MKIRNLLILGLVLLGFTYCSSDDLVDGQKPGSGETADNLKMEITIQMPTGANTRTATEGAPGLEGTTQENKPNRVIVALYKESDQTFLASYDSDGQTIAAGGAFITTAEFTLTQLTVNQKFYVYAFVNPYSSLEFGTTTESGLNKIFNAGATLDEAIAAVTKVGGAVGGAQENFFMSNSEKVLTEPIQASHIQGAPLKVGVNVQRAVARMDYEALAAGNTYEIANSATKKNASDEDLNVSVTFEKFKPMNASKSFYNLKHVVAAANALAAPDATALTAAIGVAEDNTNYVVDTDWATKITGATADDWKGNFHSYMGATTTTTADDYAAFQAKYTALDNNFYITENTMPANQNNKKGVATAVVFKGKLVFDASYVVTANEDVYVWNNKFYGAFTNLPAGIQAIGKTNTADLASAGVTGYSWDGTGYPVYYVYYNEHNEYSPADPDTDPTVGPMEFGVVRNNIYQLTIKSLKKFGHPNDPELNPDTPGVGADGNPIVINPDPSPEDPTHPIKSKELYMQVTATVLNWTVRTNEIEF